MRQLGVVGLTFVLAVVLVPHVAANSSGAPARSSGGGFPGERSCTSCHTGSDANSGPGTLSLTIDGAPAVGEPGETASFYTPGETIALIVSFADNTKFRVGFQLTVRSGDGCGQPGSLAAATSNDGSGIKTGSGTCGSAGSDVQWVTHQSPRNGSSATFAVDWTTPAEAVGPVTIAVAVNGADGARDPRNDNIYTLQKVLQPRAATPATPTISDGGVTSLGEPDSPLTTGAPGGIAVVSGTGFSATEVVIAGSADANGNLATNVGGVCVEVNQVRAPVLSVDATTAVIQIPDETATGSAAVQVIRNCDPATDGPQAVLSNTATFQIASAQPVLLQLANSMPGVSALHADYSLVAPNEATTTTTETPSSSATETVPEPGPPMSPAVPNDVVTFFGTGFGATTPSLAAGEIPSFSHVVAATSISLMFGETVIPAENIVYAGSTPGVAGMYQVSAKIPDTLAAGEYAVSLSLDMQSSPAGPTIVIGAAPDAGTVCVADLVVALGESCTGTVNVFGSEYTGTFVVEETQACVEIAGLPRMCAPEKLDPLDLGLLVAEKQADNTWKIVKFGG